MSGKHFACQKSSTCLPTCPPIKLKKFSYNRALLQLQAYALTPPLSLTTSGGVITYVAHSLILLTSKSNLPCHQIPQCLRMIPFQQCSSLLDVLSHQKNLAFLGLLIAFPYAAYEAFPASKSSWCSLLLIRLPLFFLWWSLLVVRSWPWPLSLGGWPFSLGGWPFLDSCSVLWLFPPL